MKKLLVILAILAISLSIFAYNKLTIFTVQPIGAIPDGVTVVIWKKGDMKFFESPDSLCIQKTGGVSLLCRMRMLGNAIDKDDIIIRLPYSEYAYLKSTNGRVFDR
ncbi:hypothetical protein OQ435_17540 [Proteus penneri]|uniref:hypothetical protein n=1 Tax=Proteus TaxID=583 RepID=UPI0022471415|nr:MULTISPECIES: hypothetical protein [Proteus]MCX2589971.1 hypothetical protein [Proteus penneri]WIF73834.1 hypothetical protein QN092_08155 [Proteus vulgaris]